MMQHVLIILTKRKEMIRYYESFGYGGTTLSNIIANNLMHVSVPAENGQVIPIIWAFHIIPIIWAFHFIPIMGISHRCPTAKHKQPNNLLNRTEGVRKF
jgi:hypothetical protein